MHQKAHDSVMTLLGYPQPGNQKLDSRSAQITHSLWQSCLVNLAAWDPADANTEPIGDHKRSLVSDMQISSMESMQIPVMLLHKYLWQQSRGETSACAEQQYDNCVHGALSLQAAKP